MPRIVRDPRSRLSRARPVAAGVALAALLALGVGWDRPGAGPPEKDTTAGRVVPNTLGDLPRASLVADPGQPETATEPPLEISLERVEMAPSGWLAAVLRVNGGPAGRHLQGDSLGVGVRLVRIDLDRIEVASNGKLETHGLPPGQRPLRANAPRAQGRPVSWASPTPPTPAVAQILQSPSQPGVVVAAPDRPNPARSAIDRLVVDEAMRLSAH